MKTLKLIASTSILSCILALSIIACGPIDETTHDVEFTEVTTSETATSTTTTLTSSTTAVSTRVSTVTTLVSTTAVTACTDVSTAISTNAVETESGKQEDNMQDNVQVKPVEQIEIKVEDNHYNDNKEAETTEPVVAEPEPVVTEEYVVYKPSSHYAHRSTCRWNSGDAYRCDDFSELEVRICTECNPEIRDHKEYIEPEPEPVEVPTADKDSMSYCGWFTATYYPATAYYDGVCGGSGRTLRGYGNYDDGIRGSVASRTLWSTYGYDRNGRTTVYLEFPGYEEMNGWYFLDDCSAYGGILDIFVWSSNACPFGNAGVISAECWVK